MQPATHTDRAVPIRPFVLAVGDVGSWCTNRPNLPADAQIGFTEYASLTPELISLMGPNIIVAPMQHGIYDCLDLAELLDSIDYSGCYHIIVPDIPNPRIILNEISKSFPDLKVSLIYSGFELTHRLN